MKIEDYEQYHQKGGTYVMPVEVFNELFEEMESWKEECLEYRKNENIEDQHQKLNGELRRENKHLQEQLDVALKDYDELLEKMKGE